MKAYLPRTNGCVFSMRIGIPGVAHLKWRMAASHTVADARCLKVELTPADSGMRRACSCPDSRSVYAKPQPSACLLERFTNSGKPGPTAVCRFTGDIETYPSSRHTRFPLLLQVIDTDPAIERDHLACQP